MIREYDVVVVGAGLSGLMAARELKRNGLKVGVVEAKERIGGRMHLEKVSQCSDHVVDMGGQWVGPTQTYFLALLKELGIETFKSFAEKSVLVFEGERIVFEGDISWGVMPGKSISPPISEEAKVDIENGWKDLERLIAKIQPLTHKVDDEELRLADQETMDAWINRKLKTKLGKFFFAAMCRSLGPVGPSEPSNISVLGFAMSQKAAAQSEAPEAMLIHGGAGQVPAMLAAEIGWENIFVNRRVDEIEHKENEGIRVHCKNGALLVEAKHCIVALPPTHAGRIDFSPPLPCTKQYFQRWPMGTVCKVLASYTRPFWKDEGVGAAIGDLDFIETAADASDPRKSTGVIAAFIVGKNYHAWKGLESDEERRSVVLKDLGTLFGKDALEPADLRFGDWPAEPFVGGGYGGFPAPGVLSESGHLIDEPHVDCIHWAGTEISTRWCGFFDGAIKAGLDAAQDVLKEF